MFGESVAGIIPTQHVHIRQYISMQLKREGINPHALPLQYFTTSVSKSHSARPDADTQPEMAQYRSDA